MDASTRNVPVSYLVLREQAQTRSTKALGKGFHIGATRLGLVGWKDGGHRGAQDGVITRAFGRRRPPLVRIASTGCLLSNPAVVEALRAQYLERRPGPL